jgi:hypothetical protein
VSLPDALAAEFHRQGRACAGLDSPFMHRLMHLLPAVVEPTGPVGRRLLSFGGDVGPAGHSLPLRLAGALHALVLTGDRLADAYPPHSVPDATLRAAVQDALDRRSDAVLHWLDRAPQTNEVRRSAALLAGAAWLSRRNGLPLVVSELGASAGLNLMFDRFALETGAGRIGAGEPALMLAPELRGGIPPVAAVRVAGRRGVDLSPVDPSTQEGRLRLLAYLWPDQPARRRLTEAAMAVAVAQVDRADALDWLRARLAVPHPGHLHLIVHTVAWQYFPPAVQQGCTALLEAAGARATAEAPLARLGMETDRAQPGAALWLDLWPGAVRVDLGRVDFHGRWLDWRAV